ncbi:MAG: UDP-N-acetylmuramate--L-alanine ligase [Balneola sp.]|nr:UDP-N-acetylmuramate--L-alanine ligase [Balneola sp.]MBO6649606.1 UDP-N-acetylmuramate--L-alanine ligase [Balneola sp.]MBO6711423.1 UDP-N-acetylmuramate--L-alanine ligase [Balneola sp.]MBO6801223.1 UDP-N-acetylmuramate--L-alanine ligase [Balneola sp.]MBO6869359.1 UDP-N-acetylmuramate--L-alanine ligase [Balneola sp.]
MENRIQTQPVFGRTKHIHMVGIGGIGMSGMAEILIQRGYKVTGSDGASNETTDRLKELGATIYLGHAPENIEGADVVVYTSAVKATENEETKAALENRIPTIKRAEMLAELMKMKFGIGVAGTHGKTTTTTMIGHVTQDGNYDPTIMVGGKVHSFDKTNAVVGKGDVIVVEADEFDRTFLRLTPSIAIITNIEAEHLDIYDDLEDVKGAFIDYANKVPFYGAVIVCLDDPNVRSILPDLERRIISYGLSPQAQVRAVDIQMNQFTSTFTVMNDDQKLGVITLKAPGDHNVKNALAAVATGIELNIDFKLIKQGLERYEGVFRRFQKKVEEQGVMVIDDYAHHPTEVAATLNAARKGWPDRRIVAVFQPHLYSRTQDLYKEFGLSFSDAEVLVITDVYPSREKPIEGVTGKLISDTAEQYGHKNVVYVEDKADVTETLKEISKAGDIIITMGAGDIYKYGEEFANELESGNYKTGVQ